MIQEALTPEEEAYFYSCELRLRNVLRANNLTLRQAKAMSDKELLRLPNCGRATINLIRKAK